MDEGQLRDFDFVRYAKSEGDEPKLGLIVRNDLHGGVFRGHADVWFGDVDDNGCPVITMVSVSCCTPLDDDEAPLGSETHGVRRNSKSCCR